MHKLKRRLSRQLSKNASSLGDVPEDQEVRNGGGVNHNNSSSSSSQYNPNKSTISSQHKNDITEKIKINSFRIAF